MISANLIKHARVFKVISRCKITCGEAKQIAHMTINTVLTTTLGNPPPRTGSAITGNVSLTIIFAKSRVTSNK